MVLRYWEYRLSGVIVLMLRSWSMMLEDEEEDSRLGGRYYI